MEAGNGATGEFVVTWSMRERSDSNGTTRGCVSGHTIVNLQEKIKGDDGEYQWDMIDGYEDLELVYPT